MTGSPHAATVEREFQRVLHERLLRTMFQPIVNVDSEAVVGYEALVRGPTGSILESPDALIKEAYREKRVVEFDWIARACASRTALAAGLSTDVMLFLNIEPLALASDAPPDLWPVIEEAFRKFRVVLEVTERSLDRDPSTLLEGIDRQRPTVSGLALDDVGADVRTMSMLPALEPDVIKLDLKVTQRALSRKAMKILDFVYEEVERTGATVLAEGVETKRHDQVVRQLGAPLGQGWLYGKPTDHPLPTRKHEAFKPLERYVALEEVRTPFEVLGGHTISRASTELLHSFADQVFTGGMHLLNPALALMLVPSPELLDQRALDVLSRWAGRRVVAGAVGRGVPPEPAPGVRGSWVHDPLLDGEWATIALSPSTAVAILAREVPGTKSQFDFGVTHDRRRIISAARCLMRRLGPRADQS
jgi:EAL domain-containing protein (putative c-di-GMP-specific phosphodiesterase class I)